MGSVKGLTSKYNEKDLFFTFTSFSDPGSTYHVDMDTFKVEQIATTQSADKSYNVNDYKTD